MYSDSMEVISCVTIIAQTSPWIRFLFNYLFSLIINNSLFN